MNEIRYYLTAIKALMEEPSEADKAHGIDEHFVPQYIVTAVKLPTGAIELAINNSNIAEKIDYILNAYDDEMHLKTNPDIVMQNIMVV
jgi:hypothetical protein